MFAFDADCCDCRSLNLGDEYQGKFYCEKKRDYVSANTRVCKFAAEVMGRATSDKNRGRQISKSHGYYVVTAITEILGLDPNNEYLESFKYLRDVVLEENEEYQGFVADYEEDGPALANLLREDEESEDYAEYLRATYLTAVDKSIRSNEITTAIELYSEMLEVMKQKYSYRRADVVLKEMAYKEK